MSGAREPYTPPKIFCCAEILGELKTPVMRLADWLKENDIRRRDFASRIGVSNGWVTWLCDGRAWPSREIAEKIAAETGGAVTPNDFGNFERAEAHG